MDRVRRLVGVSDDNGNRKEEIPTGKGVGIAIVDTGINTHMDFGVGRQSRIIAFADFIRKRNSCYDDCGHGTHVSGVAAGDGAASHGKYAGIAPGAGIVAIKALNEMGNGKIKDVLSSFEWIIANKEKYNIRIVNISMGSGDETFYDENCKLVLGVEKLWNSGIVVCVAAGNNGPGKSTITMPGICRSIITVGCLDDDVEVIMNNVRVKDYSGQGPTKGCVMKPEVVAPGGNVSSCGNGYRSYVSKSGTSMATPVVSGLIALVLEKYPSLSNKQIKKILNLSALDAGKDKSKQGWGRIHIDNMIKFAGLF